MRKKRTILTIIVVVLLLLAAAFAIVVKQSEKRLEALSDIPIEAVDLAAIPDGTYKGSYQAFPVAAEVNVTVQEHRMIAIDLVKHSHGQGGAAEVIPDRVMEAQSLQVDAISGATYSSRVILLAIQDALTSAANE